MSTKNGGLFVGIDVSKDRLDVAVRPEGRRWEVRNDEKDIRLLVDSLKDLPSELIIAEATGGLEIPLVSALAEAELPIVVVNPRQARAFAKAVGQLAKTDKIDAGVLAHFGEAIRPEVRPVKSRQLQELSALVSRRRQLVEMLTMEKNRLASAAKEIRKDITAHISWLGKRLKDVDGKLSRTVKICPVWREKDEIMRSVPGVGPVLSNTLLANVPELGELNRRQIASLIGVAPLNRDSGQYSGTRMVWGGRANVRSVLYMATVAAMRWNPVIKSFYQRLIGAGKKFKVAITACMRKLLTIINAMVKSGTMWQPKLERVS
jgi:transposase